MRPDTDSDELSGWGGSAAPQHQSKDPRYRRRWAFQTVRRSSARQTDPLNTDTDRDGSNDGQEVQIGTNPLNQDSG